MATNANILWEGYPQKMRTRIESMVTAYINDIRFSGNKAIVVKENSVFIDGIKKYTVPATSGTVVLPGHGCKISTTHDGHLIIRKTL